MRGTVRWFNDAKGYGSITPDPEFYPEMDLMDQSDSNEPHCFIHYTAIQGDGFQTLAEGQRVEFDVTFGPKGPQATNVRKEMI